MSYRALVTVINVAPAGNYLHVADFKLTLDDEFTLGEQIAEALGKRKTRLDAYQAAMDDPRLTPVKFESWDKRQEWLDTYGDQEWRVDFMETETGVGVGVCGTDANEDMIFYRSTKYAL